MKHWLLLAVAILAEVMATSCLKPAEGFTRFWPSVVVCVGYLTAFYCLSLVMQKLDISVVYAVWSGVGISIIALVGTFYFRQPMPPLRVAGLACVALGVVLLQLSNPPH
ncbi:multidrug transporter [Sorangium cellulosum]|uniref:Multidrug transporter n=1 Tax=Sorangium cellulosum TaxID=56 RepID=A0A2L0EJZ8_SORCE|nr:multidrug efflux SMR transporter [Sorangium cellulosum]AUX39622.1 multidrug transporter [Sorangium cellulosum]